MEFDINQVLFLCGLVSFFGISYFKEKKRAQLDNEILLKINELREDVDLVARNPQLARRNLKNR